MAQLEGLGWRGYRVVVRCRVSSSGVDERGHRYGERRDSEMVYVWDGRGRRKVNSLSLGEHLLKQREDLGHVQLDVFEIEQVLVVLLLLKQIVDLYDAGSESS